MRPPAVLRAGAVVLALALASGCSLEGREAEQAVRRYNEAAILAYRTRDFARLREVATEKEWGKVVVLVDLKSASGLVLESELEDLEVTRATKPSPDHLKVETRERWRYHDRPLQPGRPPGSVFVAQMGLEYDFVREGGAWKLDAARTLSNEYLEPKGFRPEAPHGGAPAHGEGQK